MTTVHWLIDSELFDHYRDDLVASIRANGDEVKLIRAPQPPYRWNDVGWSYRDTFPADACVIAHGDIGLINQINQDRRWTPGVFATVHNFACSSYYCHLGDYLLGKTYVMLPFGELRRCQKFLFDTVGRSGSIFIRPDSPLKLFSGQLMHRDSFDSDWEHVGFYEFPQESLVVISAPRSIISEWRFVIANREVVAGSQYKQGGKSLLSPDYEPAAFALAKTIAANDYQPDPVWVLDICKLADDSYHLLEIGGFSFSDLYACDKRAVVKAVANAAITEWNKRRSV